MDAAIVSASRAKGEAGKSIGSRWNEKPPAPRPAATIAKAGSSLWNSPLHPGSQGGNVYISEQKRLATKYFQIPRNFIPEHVLLWLMNKQKARFSSDRPGPKRGATRPGSPLSIVTLVL
jgi:hypothetical protein